jgi:hypothetical protein
VVVFDPESGAADPRLCWAYALLWSHLLADEACDDASNDDDGKKFRRPLTATEGLRQKNRRRHPEAASVGAVVFSFLLGECLSLVHKLDLSLDSSDDNDRGGGPVPSNVFNHDLLLNLTAFLEGTLEGSALSSASASLFGPWAATYFRGLVSRSKALPEVSALYRLIGLGLRLATKGGLFTTHDTAHDHDVDDDDGGGSSDGDDPMGPSSPFLAAGATSGGLASGSLSSSLQSDFAPLRRYLASVIHGLGRFSDELLCACLAMVLSAPPELVPRAATVPALGAALVAGRAHVPTAALAVGGLEAWLASDLLLAGRGSSADSLNGSLDAHLPVFLPLLETYLFDASGGQGAVVVGSSGRKGQRPSKRRGGGDLDSSGLQGAAVEALQLRVVRLLGRLGGRNKGVAIDASAALRQAIEGWGEAPAGTLPLEVPLPMAAGASKHASSSLGAVVLHVPELLPRLATLCLGAQGDHQAKALAAETFHAAVVLLVGTSATDAGGGKHYLAIWAKVFPVVVALAADVAVVATRVLFGKLLGQLVHWLSGDPSKEGEAACLLAALSDGIAAQDSSSGAEGAASSSGVRALCATSMAEFLR